MTTWALINKQTDIVENIIHWDGVDASYKEPSEVYKINVEGIYVVIGQKYDKENNQWFAPEWPVIEQKKKPTLEDLQEQLSTIAAQIAALSNTSG